MRLRLQKADAFLRDFAAQTLWYAREAPRDVPRRFLAAVESTLYRLADQPMLGRARGFKDPSLQGLRSFAVERPFHRFVVFYRIHGDTLQAVRLMDGGRDLPRRLGEPPRA